MFKPGRLYPFWLNKMLPFRKIVPQLSRKGRLTVCKTAKVFASSTPLNRPLDVVQEVDPLNFQGYQVTKLENGLKVATIDTCSPVSKIGLVINAGARYETPSNTGITHCLRAGAFSSTKDRTAFRITREVEHNGSTLEATSTREHLILSSDCLRDRAKAIVETLGSVTSKPLFNPWEVEDITEQVKFDNAVAETQTQIGVLEAMHSIAYRNTLGNSLYCLASKVGSINQNVLMDYVTEMYVGNRMALVGVGIAHGELVNLAKLSFASIPAGSPVEKQPAVYHGGEIHRETGGILGHAVMVSEGAGLQGKDFSAISVLQRLLGSTPYVKWGSNVATSRLNLAVSEVTDGPYAVSSFNASYTDSGLFGFYLIGEGSYMRPALRSCVAAMRNISKGNIPDAELARAKNQTKAHILMNAETQSALFEDLGIQVMMKDDFTTADEGCAAIDKVTGEDLVQVAKKIFKGKPTLSAAGNVSNTPYLDELI